MRLFSWLWWHLPLSREKKERLKTVMFTALPRLFEKSRAYKNWKSQEAFSARYDIHRDYAPGLDDHGGFSDRVRDYPVYKRENVFLAPIQSIAVVIHAFYFDVFLDMMAYFNGTDVKMFHFYITTPESLKEEVSGYMDSKGFPYEVLGVDNHGRDILPFFKIMPRVMEDGHELILKLHTKKSDHRQTAELWRKDLFRKLIHANAIRNAIQIFGTVPDAGLMGPSGHIVPMSLYYGANARAVAWLSRRMGVSPATLPQLNFVAGSMFYIRRQALIPLLNLGWDAADFEVEDAQLDGTMAHAVERAFAVSTCAAGLKLVDSDYKPQSPSPAINRDHPFTW
jgi:lipopolysaccharide biosynthesis protein